MTSGSMGSIESPGTRLAWLEGNPICEITLEKKDGKHLIRSRDEIDIQAYMLKSG